MALSLSANAGANPSGNRTAARPWWFLLSFTNDFTFTPAYPNPLTNLTTDISNDALSIKRAALQELRDAYTGTALTVVEGGSGGDVLAAVVDHQTLIPNSPDCGATTQGTLNGKWSHQVDYSMNMIGAQNAYQVVINNAQDESTVLAQRPDVIRAIGRGLGASAAHEIAHRFLWKCCTMDSDPQSDPDARGTFNATGCDGLTDPSPWTGYWPDPKILLHWEPPALNALGQCLNGGWRDFHHESCHN